jgi:hypothetical protein
MLQVFVRVWQICPAMKESGRIGLGEEMDCAAVIGNRFTADRVRQIFPVWGFLILWIGCSVLASAQSAGGPTNLPFSIRATHLLGFEGAKSNAKGTLSIQGDALQFQRDGRPAVQVKVVSIQDIVLGEQSQQVGGLPATLGKAAAPYGGGRVVSLFAHKKYDTLTVQYLDANGALHGAIFQLRKGQGNALRSALVAKGAHVSEGKEEAGQPNTRGGAQ